MGNKLPPFYIGHSSVKKVENGYHGSVSSKAYHEIWISELKDNPHLFKTRILTVHHSKKEAYLRELDFQRKLKVVHNPLYANKAIWTEVVDNRGRKHTEQSRLNMSIAHKGKPQTYSATRAQAISKAKKGRRVLKLQGRKLSEEHKAKMRLSCIDRPSNTKGTKWYHNGVIQKRLVPGTEPEGWINGQINNGWEKRKMNKKNVKIRENNDDDQKTTLIVRPVLKPAPYEPKQILIKKKKSDA